MATPIYKRILEAKKRAQNNEIHPSNEGTPVTFKNVTGVPNAAYGEDTIADTTKSTDKLTESANQTDIGECIDGKNSVTNEDCKMPSEILEEQKQKREDRRNKRKKHGGEGTKVGNFLRGLFGGDSGTVAKLVEDPSGATIVKDAGTPIDKKDDDTPIYKTGNEKLEALTSGGPNQGLGEGETIVIDGKVYDSSYNPATAGETTGGGSGTTENLPTSTEEFKNPALPDQTWPEFVDAPCGSPGKPFGSGMCADVEPGTTSKGDPEKYNLKPKQVKEETPGEDAKYAYNMGWADTVMQNWQQGAERRGNERNERKNMNKIWKNLGKNERNELKNIIDQMKDDGTAPRGAKNQRLAALQIMNDRALNDPKFADNPAYSNFGEGGKYNIAWGSGSQDANIGLFDTTTKSYGDKVLNQLRNNKGADVSVGGQGGGQIKVTDKVDPTSTTRDMLASDLSEADGIAHYGSKEAWLEAKRKEAGNDPGTGEVVNQNNEVPLGFAEGSLMDEINKAGGAEGYAKNWAKNLRGDSLKRFMEKNPTGVGVQPHRANNTVLDNVTVEGDPIDPPKPKDVTPLETDPVDPPELELRDEAETVERIDAEGTNTGNTRTDRLVSRMADAYNEGNTQKGDRLRNKLKRKNIENTQVELMKENAPTKFKLKRGKLGRPGYKN